MVKSTGGGSGADRVLVVDDEKDILESMKDLLEASLEGTQIHTATSAKKGLEILAEEDIDLVISDYKMPNMNGLEFLAEAQKRAPGVPRILLTAFPDVGIATRAVNEAGIENFITKPFEPLEAIETVARILELRHRAGRGEQPLARGSGSSDGTSSPSD